jgi:5,10-methylenetetrahydromethanopterin reductase
MVNFGIEFVPRDLFWKTTYYAIQSEKQNFDYLWMTDHFNNRNVYVSLSIVATYTDRIKLGPGVTNPYMVHPAVTAQAVSSLSEVAPGRVVCGLGVGDKTTLNMVNITQQKPLSAIRESVQIVRELTSNRPVNLVGELFNASGTKLNFNVSNPIPIFIGAQGPKMLTLAAEIGDGVLINASHPKDIEKAMKHIREGAERVNKPIADLEVAAYTSFSVAEETRKAVKAVVPVVAYIVAGCPEIVLQNHGISPETAAKIRQAIVQGNWKEAFSAVTAEMIESFSVCGTPNECIEKIDRLVKLGVTQFVAGSPIGPDVRRSINLIGSLILPHFRG